MATGTFETGVVVGSANCGPYYFFSAFGIQGEPKSFENG